MAAEPSKTISFLPLPVKEKPMRILAEKALYDLLRWIPARTRWISLS